MWTRDSSSCKYKWHWCCSSRHYVYLCVYFFLVITWHVRSCGAPEIWSVLLAHTELKEINFWLLRKLTQVVKCRVFHSVVTSNFSTKARKNQRTETLICDDMLIYSLELLHWPWMGDWLCVLIQCLPEVSHPSGFYIDSAITFKAENVPRSQENNSENCRGRVFHHFEFISTETSETHLYTHVHRGVLLRRDNYAPTATHKHKHTCSFSSESHFFPARQTEQQSDSASWLPWRLQTSGRFSHRGG